MDYLNQLLGESNLPILSAFILGIMTAISPCPLATNITATAYISQNIKNKRMIFINGLIYTLGRAISYTLLGIVLYMGASKFSIASFFQSNGERILGPLLLIIGLVMLDIFKFSLPGFGKLSERLSPQKTGNSTLSALLLGIVFALAFCPYSGVIYFGMLIPLSVSSVQGLLLPAVFAFATGLPVIIIAYLLAFTLSGVGTFYNKVKSFEFWFRKIVAVLFILTGVYYIFIFFVG